MADETTLARRATIRELLRGRRVATQDELRKLLARRGHDVTQATLSRDLSKLRARRLSLPEGGTVYELADQLTGAPGSPGSPSSDEALERLRPLVTSVNHNGSLVVVLTTPAAASAVALSLDSAKLPEVLGTLAGDDTIFVAPSGRSTAAGLAKRLKRLWLNQENP